VSDPVRLLQRDDPAASSATRELEQLLAQPMEPRRSAEDDGARIHGVLVGTLVGFRERHEPLVTYDGQPGSAALSARASVDVFADHIGHQVTLMFEDGDPLRPIVTGRIRVAATWPVSTSSPQVEVDADGQRLTLAAKDQLVLQCGKASITLTAAGKVIVQGAYLSTRSSGVVRIRGGSIQLN
jgi:hypothetical protein